MINHKQFSGFSEEISKIILYKNLSISYSLFGREREEREAGLAFVGGCRFSTTIP